MVEETVHLVGGCLDPEARQKRDGSKHLTVWSKQYTKLRQRYPVVKNKDNNLKAYVLKTLMRSKRDNFILVG